MRLGPRAACRPLTAVGPRQRGGIDALCALEPAAGVTLASQVSRWPSWGRGDVVVLGRPGAPDAAAWATGSLIPFGLAPRPHLGHRGASPLQVSALAEHARGRLVRRGSVFGPAADVELVWAQLAAAGVRSREERWNQLLLTAPVGDGSAHCSGAAWAREGLVAASADMVTQVLPASVAMFVEEVGEDPLAGGPAYARHVEWLIGAGRTYVVLDDGAGRAAPPAGGTVAFKADVGGLWRPPSGPAVAQLTGVWTRPDLRGRGVARAALAATIAAVRRDHVGGDGVVSLYVNDFNAPALGLYRSVGMSRVGTFATVLL